MLLDYFKGPTFKPQTCFSFLLPSLPLHSSLFPSWLAVYPTLLLVLKSFCSSLQDAGRTGTCHPADKTFFCLIILLRLSALCVSFIELFRFKISDWFSRVVFSSLNFLHTSCIVFLMSWNYLCVFSCVSSSFFKINYLNSFSGNSSVYLGLLL